MANNTNNSTVTVEDVKQRILERMMHAMDEIGFDTGRVKNLAEAYATLHEARPKRATVY